MVLRTDDTKTYIKSDMIVYLCVYQGWDALTGEQRTLKGFGEVHHIEVLAALHVDDAAGRGGQRDICACCFDLCNGHGHHVGRH